LRSLSLPNHVLHQIYLQHHSTLQLGLLSRKSDVPVCGVTAFQNLASRCLGVTAFVSRCTFRRSGVPV
jgi:hypothetical protein